MQCSDRRKLMWMTLNITTIVLILFTGEKNKNYIYVKILLILLFKVFNLLMNLNWYSITWQLKQWILVLLLLSFFIFFFGYWWWEACSDHENCMMGIFFFTFLFLIFSVEKGECVTLHTLDWKQKFCHSLDLSPPPSPKAKWKEKTKEIIEIMNFGAVIN